MTWPWAFLIVGLALVVVLFSLGSIFFGAMNVAVAAWREIAREWSQR
jgi:hypothetical protein